jgi:DNA-directed RNA polymerase specialized sigma24 family protein
MGQGLSITADSRIITFNSMALHYQDEAYTLAYYLLGDEGSAEKATQAAFAQLYQNARLQANHFRLEVLRRVLVSCQGWFGSLPGRAKLRTKTSAVAGRGDDLSWKLMDLKEAERSAVVLVDVLGLDYAEAAQVLSSSKKQVSRLLAQARLNLSQAQTIMQ